ncbi:SRPBCC domain-containing protein [Allorhizobium terrae]|uniref:SRPBCC domain-containing protein n=1 Tax=Allorhizobium terrae TaxID=1848972 RepID=A0A4S3ZU48_9HYPH|nr:SRPBCC domain-containing protein [Allorhizobium terrae]THF49235.1 SRPBCC domain-containing protein [Allorhizobium terrae]TWD44829.1 hypothetical protein FB480_12025 [Agrobacterium vitis]
MARTLEMAIEINAPAQDVWRVLTDFPSFADWSRFILSAEGKPAQGERLMLKMNDGGGIMTFTPQVVVCTPAREFGWRGVVGAGFIFAGEHRFILQERAQGITHLIQRETFSGLLVPLLWKKLNTRTRAAFADFNMALKTRVEAGKCS